MKKRFVSILFVLLLLFGTVTIAGTFNDFISSLFVFPTSNSNTVQSQSINSLQSQNIQQAPAALAWVAYPPSGTWPKEPGFGIWTSKTVYDPIQNKTILYASDSGATYSNSFWAYDSTTHTWQQKTSSGSAQNANCPSQPPNHPNDRHPYNQMGYDTLRNRLYLYGGVYCSGVPYTDTWYYGSSTNTWTQVFPSTNPGQRTESQIAYDSQNDVIVIHGSLENFLATWHYFPATNTWIQISTTNAPAKSSANMIYDSVNRKIVLFGGRSSYGGSASNDIWLYDSQTRVWTNPNPTVKPQALIFPSIAFDSKRGLIFYFAGQGILWVYNVATNTWTNLNVPGGPSLIDTYSSNGYTLSYDPSTDKLISNEPYGSSSIQTWELDLSSLPVGNVTDTTPPILSNLNPQGTQFSSSTTQANLSLNTNEAATCKFSTQQNIAYSSMILTFATTGSTSHSTTITGLTPGSYNYYVRCQDTSGNANTNDAQIYFTVQSNQSQQSGIGSIPLTVREVVGTQRIKEPVTTGVPLPLGTQTTNWSLWEGTVEIPVQITKLKGNANWILLDFQTDLAPNQIKSLTLKDIAPLAAPANQIQKTETATTTTLNTGPLEITMRKDIFNLFETVKLNGITIASSTGSNIILIDSTGAVFNANAAQPTNITQEYIGPLRTTIKFDGPFTNWAGMSYTVRVSVYAGGTQAKVEYIIRNSLQSNQRHAHINSARLQIGGAGTLVRSTTSGDIIATGYQSGGLIYDLISATDAANNNGMVLPDLSYTGATVLVDFSNPSSSEITRQQNAAKSPLIALASARWLSDYGDLSTIKFGTLEDERQIYRNLGLNWSTNQEPLDSPKPDYKITWQNIDVHYDPESDDLWQNLIMYLRTDGIQYGFFHRARAWARYYKWEYAQRTDGFEYAWNGNFEPNPISRPDISTGLTTADQNIVSYYHSGKIDGGGDGITDFGGDHSFGYSLADWYHLTGDLDALDSLRDIAEEDWRFASRNTPGTTPVSNYGLRMRGRWFLNVQRYYEMSNADPTWKQRRDYIADVFRLSPDWDNNFGMYYCQDSTSSCTYAQKPLCGAFHVVWAAWPLYRYYLDTSSTWARDKLIAMGNFVDKYGLDPATNYTGSTIWLDCRFQGDVYHAPGTISFGHTTYLTDIPVIAYRVDSNQSHITTALYHWIRGTCGVFSASPGQVCDFADSDLDPTGNLYFNNGYLPYAELLLREASGLDVTSQQAVLTITSPTSGQNIASPQVNVIYSKSGVLTNVDHANLQLDSNPAVSDLDFDGLYNFTSVPIGSHIIQGYLAYTNNTQVPGTLTSVSFTTSPPDTTPPVISSIQSFPSSNSATITWSTDEISTSQVEYGTTSAYGFNTTVDQTLVISHSVTFTGLINNTIYHYRIKSRDASDNLAVSADNTFTTTSISTGNTQAILEYKFDSTSGQTVLDTSLNNNDGVLGSNSGVESSDPTWVVGKLNNALSFDGVDDFVTSKDINFGGTQPITICAWIKPNTLTGFHDILAQGTEIVFRMEDSSLVFILNSFTSNDRVTVTNPAITAGQWSYVCGTYNSGGDMVVYVDSVEKGRITPTGTYLNDPNTFIMGKLGPSGSNEVWNGLIDELVIFNRSLLASEINNLYNGAPQILGDTTPPSITNLLQSPISPVTYTSPQTHTFTSTITDNTALQTVYLENNFNGQTVNTTLTSATSTYSYSRGALPAGIYTYKLIAIDSSANQVVSPQQTYQVVQAPSQVQLTLNGQRGPITVSQGQQVQIIGTLTTPTQDTVTIYQNTVSLNTGASPLSIIQIYNTTGNYNITAYYGGNQNYSSSYETHFVQVGPGPDTAPPSVIINSPQDNSVITSSQVLFNCSAADNVILSNISLVLDNQIDSTIELNTQTTTQTFTRILSDGIHTFACGAYDNSSNKATSQTRTITINTICTTNCEMNISLVQGANLISLPLVQQNYSIDSVIQSIKQYVDTIYTYDPIALWKVYHTDPLIPSTLSTLEPRKGFFVIARSPAVLTIRGDINPVPPLTLSQGWNLIGIHNLTDMNPDDAVTLPYLSIWDLPSGLQTYRKINTTTDRLLPSKGYWVYL